MSNVDKLRKAWEDAEAKAFKLQADKDEALSKVSTRFGNKLRKAVDDSAKAQKVYLDAEAADGLRQRRDEELDGADATAAEAIRSRYESEASRLGLSLD